jgi:hypothetical protein
MNGGFHRQCTNQYTGEDAKRVIEKWEPVGSWDLNDAPPKPPEPTAEVQPDVVTVKRAVKAYLAEHEEHATLNIIKKYKILMGKFRQYSRRKRLYQCCSVDNSGRTRIPKLLES